MSNIILGDCLEAMRDMPSSSVDCIVTDPPYGYSFMGKDWDKAVPSVGIWQECLRLLKPGAFMCVMSAPRSDVQNAMISRLMEAGFRLDFTPIYWSYASGFPKAMNIGKAAEGKMLTGNGNKQAFQTLDGDKAPRGNWGISKMSKDQGFRDTDYSADINKERTLKANLTTPEAKALDGSYAGFQPKPAVEVIIVAMKPLSEKTFVDQALKNGKGISWLDDARIPHSSEADVASATPQGKVTSKAGHAYTEGDERTEFARPDTSGGRFPANLLVSDDVLNDGTYTKDTGHFPKSIKSASLFRSNQEQKEKYLMGGGSHSRYFDLDKWAQTLPFLITPKASKSEKNKGLEHLPQKQTAGGGGGIGDYADDVNSASGKYGSEKAPANNHHPTVKPLKLMSYLITLFTRPDDTVLDPFAGSGTTGCAAKQLERKFIGIEREAEYVEIAKARLADTKESAPTLL